ncbi:MAG: polysaccharide biosynthesis protein [Desulfobacteraceae bacterium]|nr:polysaccharide biosynthesis protein [Desulfobacteraceae bacterium]
MGFADEPNQRSSHSVTVPKGGGIGILAAFVLASIIYGVNAFVWIPVALVGVLGLVNDRMELSPLLRLGVELCLGLILFAVLEDFGASLLHYLVAAFFWSLFISGTANFFNFMDGINGIAGISAVIALGFSCWFISRGQPMPPIGMVAGCVAMACLGFLPFNLPVARVFMGDTASLFLGFLFGSLVCTASGSLTDFGVMVSFLFPFYADALSTLVVRIKDGENILVPHRRHLYQLLANELSMAHWKVALFYGAVQTAAGISAIQASRAGAWAVFLLLGLLFALFFIVSWHLRKRIESQKFASRNVKRRIFSRNIPLVLMVDLVLLMFSLWVSCIIRFDSAIPLFIADNLKNSLPLIVIIKLSVFSYCDLYRGMWRYTSVSDLLNIFKASFLSTLLIISAVLFLHGFEGFPRSVFMVDCVMTVCLVSIFRLCVRFYYERLNNESGFEEFSLSNLWAGLVSRNNACKKMLIIGAGDCGEKILREIQNNPAVKFQVVGFLDDNPLKVGKKIHGVLVLNSVEHLESVARRVDADELLIAAPSSTAEEMKRIVGLCEKSGLKFKTIPTMGELINGTVTVGAIREVSFRDLLGRKPVELDQQRVAGCLDHKRILVTGAGGSIGSELCRQICRFNPESVIVVDWAETPLFEIDYELKRHFPDIHTIPVLADIQDEKQLERIFRDHTPHVVFHAAAYKHVAMLERQPWKAVVNNIFGTVNVSEVAKKFGVGRFVLVSTDKAVTPSSVMGASKRIAEIYVQNQNRRDSDGGTKFMTVRFGNVAGSAGSVVPLFKKQIQEGGPVTVTHPEVSRFFMTIPEASQLILQAGAMGKGNEIFILEMGRPVKILNMAKELIRLYGYQPDVDIKIEYIGLRKGEKLFEELVSDGEAVVSTSHKSIMVLKGRERSLDGINGSFLALNGHALNQDASKIMEEFRKIVPGYTPSNMVDSGYPPN